jgi:hypothetical protein
LPLRPATPTPPTPTAPFRLLKRDEEKDGRAVTGRAVTGRAAEDGRAAAKDGRGAAKDGRGVAKDGRGVAKDGRGAAKLDRAKPPPNPRPKAEASVATRHELLSAASAVTARTDVRVMVVLSVKPRCDDLHLSFGSPHHGRAFAFRLRVYNSFTSRLQARTCRRAARRAEIRWQPMIWPARRTMTAHPHASGKPRT